MIFQTNEPDDFLSIAQKILNNLKPISGQATVLAFEGDLGVGKTTLTQFIARALLIKKRVMSPTFVLRRSYRLSASSFKKYGWKKLIHYDWYRLAEQGDLLALDWHSDLEEGTNLIIVEWPKQVKKGLPKGVKKINLTHLKNGGRKIKLTWL